jgi:hypothetical protein
VADPKTPLRAEASEEAPAPADSPPPLRWFPVDEALGMDLDPGLKRMIRKAMALLGERPRLPLAPPGLESPRDSRDGVRQDPPMPRRKGSE